MKTIPDPSKYVKWSDNDVKCTLYGLGDKFIVCQHNDRQFKVMIPKGVRGYLNDDHIGCKVLIRYLAKFDGRYTNPVFIKILDE